MGEERRWSGFFHFKTWCFFQGKFAQLYVEWYENPGCSWLLFSHPDLISSRRKRSVLKPSEKNMLLSAINQHWPRRPISLSCMETCMMFLPHPKVSIWAQSESHPLLMTTDIAPWMHMEAQLAPAKDQLFCVLVVRKPVCETLSERRGQWVLEIPQLCRVSLVFIHICKNVFQASCTVISNLYCSLLAVLTTYVANILLQIRKSVNDCKNQEFRTCMYLFFFFILKHFN